MGLFSYITLANFLLLFIFCGYLQVIIARNRVNRWTVKDGNEPDHTT